jgi:translation initiation factor IF-3
LKNPSDKDSGEQGPRQNRQITAKRVLVIDEEGNKLGEMATRDALTMAQDRGLDLIEVAANARPPVCRFADYGKILYEKKKRTAKAKKNATTITVKEVKFTPSTGEHDFNTKLKHVQKFLSKGDKVKVTIRFRGREMAHKDNGEALCNRLVESINESEQVCEVEMAPQFVGRQMTMILAPKRS